MELLVYAENELNAIIEKNGDEDGIQRAISEDILDIVSVFANQGHSGFSASYAIGVLKRVLNYKPLSPLTGEDDEWFEREDWGDGKHRQQNKRCFSVFRENYDNTTAKDTEAKVFSDDGGLSWWGGSNSIEKISFPYIVPDSPKHVYLSENQDHEIFGDEITELREKKEKEYAERND